MKTSPEINNEIISILRVVYNDCSKNEKEEMIKQIEQEEYLKDAFDEIIREKTVFEFKSIEEHIELIKLESKRIEQNFKNLILKNESENLKVSFKKWKIITYISAVAATIAILVVVFKPSGEVFSEREYQALSDSLKFEKLIASNLTEEIQILEDNLAMRDSELVSVKQSIDSLKQVETSLSTLRKENTNLVTEISQKDAEINILNSEVNLLQQNMKGYSKIDNAKRFMALSSGESERIVDPTYHGNIMGGHEKLDLEIKSPKNLDFYLKNQPLEFAWKTKEKGKASLSCFLAMNDELVFEKEILLESEKEVLEKNTLNYGTYYWMISQEEAVSDIQYFIIISW